MPVEVGMLLLMLFVRLNTASPARADPFFAALSDPTRIRRLPSLPTRPFFLAAGATSSESDPAECEGPLLAGA